MKVNSLLPELGFKDEKVIFKSKCCNLHAFSMYFRAGFLNYVCSWTSEDQIHNKIKPESQTLPCFSCCMFYSFSGPTTDTCRLAGFGPQATI